MEGKKFIKYSGELTHVPATYTVLPLWTDNSPVTSYVDIQIGRPYIFMGFYLGE